MNKRDVKSFYPPPTMATQHPDNAAPPYWGKKAYFTAEEEVEECYRCFKELGCREYMWDWEGKYVDEAAADKLLTQYTSFFKRHPLGGEFFLTIRVPNIWFEKTTRTARAFMSVTTAQDIALELDLPEAPVFQIILPMAERAEMMVEVQSKYNEVIKAKCVAFQSDLCGPLEVEIIPLVEDVDRLMNMGEILEDYCQQLKSRQNSVRGFIARSDPSLQHGLVPAVLAAKVAVNEQYLFQKKEGMPVYPMIGVGSLPFRGGLTPYRCKEFLKEYKGIRTVTLQSAFRYDYPLADVKKAVRYLNRELSGAAEITPDPLDKELAAELNHLFSPLYRKTIESISPLINSTSEHIPARRERISETGPLGYARSMGRKSLPRGVKFTASLYSLGIPPEIIGTGRGLKAAASAGLLDHLKKVYVNLHHDLKTAGSYLNLENLAFLAASHPALHDVEEDAALVEEYLGLKLEPTELHHFLHRNHVSNIHHLQGAGENFDSEVIAAALCRRSLG